MMLRPRPRSPHSPPTPRPDPPSDEILDDLSSPSSSWPVSLTFPLLDRTMTSYSDNSSVVSSSSAEAGTASSVDMVQSAALYFNNLRIASSDDDEPPGTPPSAIFRAQRTLPSQDNRSTSISNYGSIIRNSSSSSSRLPIPFRPSREFDDDDDNDATTMMRTSRDDTNVPFDPYGDDPVSTTAATTSGGFSTAPLVPLLLQYNDEGVVESASVSFPPLAEGAFATVRSTPIPRSASASKYEDPPLEAPSSVTSASSSISSANRSSSPFYSAPRTPTPIPQALTNYNECHPSKRARVPTSAKTSTQGVLAVQGAGIPSVNGAYKRTGRFDRVGMYTKRTIHHGRPVTFTIFRCIGSDFSRKWHLSIVSSKAKRGASSMSSPSHDVDLYTAPSIGGGSAEELPPETGWRSVGLTGSGLDEIHNNIKTPHCLWIPIHNKRAGSPSAAITTSGRYGCGSNKRVKTQVAAADQQEATATTTRRVVQCCVCMDANASHVFVPCGHAAVCGGCSEQWKANLLHGKVRRRLCPIGRCKVKGVIKLYGTIVEDV